MVEKRVKTGGRKLGSKNKLTTSVKDALLATMNAGDGAVEFWINLKESEPKTFATICGKLLPREVVGADGKDLRPSGESLTFDQRVDVVRGFLFMMTETERMGNPGATQTTNPTPKPIHSAASLQRSQR